MILYITRKFPPSIGGMQRFNFKLVSNLKNITNIKLISWGGSQAILPIFLIVAFLKSLFICLTHRIDCIYVSDGLLSPLGLVLKILTRKPVVANIHGRDIAFHLKIYQIVVGASLRRLDKVICVSDTLKSECIKRGIPENILHVIPNGVDVSDFDNAANASDRKTIAAMIGKPIENRPILLTVGRLIAKKGVDSFLEHIFPEILKEKNNVVCLIAGDGPLHKKIQDIIEDNGYHDNVFLIGKVPMDGATLPMLYRTADVFVMPNVPVEGDIEGFGIVALEAAAAGTAVVASRTDGITEAVHDGENGYLVVHNDYEQYAKVILNLLSNEEQRNALGNKARTFVNKQYSWKHISQLYADEFKKVFSSQKKHGKMTA